MTMIIFSFEMHHIDAGVNGISRIKHEISGNNYLESCVSRNRYDNVDLSYSVSDSVISMFEV